MANNRVNIQLGFQADISQAKQQLKQLSMDLDAISMKKINFGGALASDITKASNAATELSVHLKNATNVDTGRIDLTKFLSSVKQGNLQLDQLAADLVSIGPQGAMAFAQVARAISTAEIPMIRFSNVIKKFGTTLFNTLRWQLSSSLITGFVSGLTEAIQYVSDLNESLNNIRIVTGYGAEEMEKFAIQANQAAKALKTTTNEYAKASLIYFQQGLSGKEVEERAATTIKLANVTKESAETVSDWMTAIWNNFDDGSKSLEHYADVMTALGAATASSSDEIAGGLEKFAAISKTIGLSYEYAASALATVTAVTRQSEDVVGTSFKTIFARMEGLTLGDTLDDGTTLNKYSEALKTIGVDILDVNGELRQMDSILNDMGSRWDALTQAQKVAVAQAVGGLRQYNQLIALMDNWDYFQENLNTAMTSEGELSNQAEIYAESWQAARDQVTAAAETIYNELLDDKALITIMDGFALLLEHFSFIIEKANGLKGVLTAISGILLTMTSKSIAAGFSAMSTAFIGMTEKGRQNLRKQQNEQLEFAKSQIETKTAGKTSADYQAEGYDPSTATTMANADNLKARTINSVVSNDVAMSQKFTATEEARSQAMNDIIKKNTDLARLEGEQLVSELDTVEALQQEISKLQEIQQLEKNDVDYFDKEANRELYAQDETKKMEDGYSFQDMAQEAGVKDPGQVSSTYRHISTELSKMGEMDVVKTTPELTKQFKELQVELNSTTTPAKTVAEKFKNFAKNAKDVAKTKLDKTVKNQSKAVKDLNKKLDQGDTKLKGFGQSCKKVIDQMDNQPVISFGQSFISLAGSISSLGFGLQMMTSSFKEFGAMLTDGEFSAEGFLSAMTSLAMGIPMLITGFSTLRTSLSALTAGMLFNTAVSKGKLSIDKLQAALEPLKLAADKKELILTTVKNKEQLKELVTKGKITKATYQQIIANMKLQLSMWQIMLIMMAVAAAAAIVITVVKAITNSINAHNIAAEKAGEASKNAAEAATKAKEAYDGLKDSVANWKKARENIDNLKRGTDEFREAVLEANEQAMALINTYNLGVKDWKIGSDGIIEIDEEALENVQTDYLDRAADASARAALMKGSAKMLDQRANEIEYLNGSSDVGVTYYVISGNGNSTPVTTTTQQEQEFLNYLQEQYDQLSKTGDEAILNNPDKLKEILAQSDSLVEKEYFTQLSEDFAKAHEDVYELLKTNNAIVKSNKEVSKSAILTANSLELNQKYDDIRSELIAGAQAEKVDIAKILEEEIIFSDWSNGITIGGRNNQDTEKYLKSMGVDFTNFHSEEDFFDEYLKTMYGEDALSKYRVVHTAGDQVTIQVKEGDSWTNLDGKEDNSWYEDEMAKTLIYQKLLGISGDQLKEHEKSLEQMEKVLDDAGLTLSEKTKDIAAALMSTEETIESYGELNRQEIESFNEALIKSSDTIEDFDFDRLVKTDAFSRFGDTAETLQTAVEEYAKNNNMTIGEALIEMANGDMSIVSSGAIEIQEAQRNAGKNILNAFGLDPNNMISKETYNALFLLAKDYHELFKNGTEETKNLAKQAVLDTLDSDIDKQIFNEFWEQMFTSEDVVHAHTFFYQILNDLTGVSYGKIQKNIESFNSIAAEDIVRPGSEIYALDPLDAYSSMGTSEAEAKNFVKLGTNFRNISGEEAQNLLNTAIQSAGFKTNEEVLKVAQVINDFDNWLGPWAIDSLKSQIENEGIEIDESFYTAMQAVQEEIIKTGNAGLTAVDGLNQVNKIFGSIKSIAKSLKSGETISKEDYEALQNSGIQNLDEHLIALSDGTYFVLNAEDFQLQTMQDIKNTAKDQASKIDEDYDFANRIIKDLQEDQGSFNKFNFNADTGVFSLKDNADYLKFQENFINEYGAENFEQLLLKSGAGSLEKWNDEENRADMVKKIQEFFDWAKEDDNANSGKASYIAEHINSLKELEEYVGKDSELYTKFLPEIEKREKALFASGNIDTQKARVKQNIEMLQIAINAAKTEKDKIKYIKAQEKEQKKLNELTEENIKVKAAELEKQRKDMLKQYADYKDIVTFTDEGLIQVDANYKQMIGEHNTEAIAAFEATVEAYINATKEYFDALQEQANIQQKFQDLKEDQLIKNQERVIDRLQRRIDSLSKTKDRAWGKERIKLMEQEIGLQDKMAAEQLKLKNLYEQQAAAAREELAAYSEYVSFDKNGLLKFNTGASGIGSSEQLEELQDLVDKYDEALEGMWDAQDAAIEASMDSYDLRLEQLSYIIEMQILGNQENIALLERALEKLEDKMFSAAERLNNLIAQAIEYGKQIDAYDPDKLLSGFGLTKDATDKESWVALFQKYTQANRSGTIEQLEESRDALAELETQIYDLSKSVADVLLEAFEEFGESFDKLEERSSTLSSIVDSYNNIVNLTRQFTEVDASMVQSLIDANATLSKTSMNTAKTEYETLLASQKLIQERYNSSKISDSSLASYWKQQLDEINSLVESARADFMSAWEEALQAAAEAFKASIENIVSTFEKSMTGAFGTYASMQKAYEQQSKVMNRYLAVYERTYELTKLTRKLDKDLDETDNLKARETLKDLQDEINELQRAEVEMSKNDLTFLQKKYDLRLAEIALEEAQKAKNSVTLQRNSEGGWGYVYTADQNNIAEAQQKYEDTFQQTYKSQMDNIKSLEGSLLGNIQAYLNEIKANEGDQEALERVQNTYNELLAADAAEIDRAINNINELVNETDLEGYESINFANTLLGEVLGEYETAGLWSEEFLQKLTEQVLIPTTEQITEQEKIMNDLLEFGADGSFGENLKAFEDEIIKANEQLNKDIEERGKSTELADAINIAFSKDMEIVFDYYSKVEGALEKIRQALEAARWAAENTPTHTPSYRYSGDDDRTYQTVELFTTTTVKNKNKIKETPWSEVKVNANDLTVVHSTSSGEKIYEDSKGNRYSTYKTPDLYKSFETLDTGGYTGAWGTEGRLALLHQKEIVLNATDTENFLSAIGIMRSIVDIINLQATANAFNNSKLKAANIPSSGSLEQQVTIHAEFPNVTNHYEIEEALNNIVNSASQYANRKI